MDSINSYIEKNLSEKRIVHTYAVRDLAVDLAKHYGEDVKKAEIAALFHDMFKNIGNNAANMYVRELSLDKKYIDNINLAHSKLAAIIMKRDYNITDEDIINAVSYHTTGRAEMSLLEKIIYIADAAEPNRKYNGAQELRKLAFENLDKACLLSLLHTRDYVLNQGEYLDEDTLAAIDWFETKYNFGGNI